MNAVLTRAARSPARLAAALGAAALFTLLMFSWLEAPGEVVTAGKLTAYLVGRALVLTIAAFPALGAAALLAATARSPRWGSDPFPVSLARHALGLAAVYTVLLFVADPIARRSVDASLFSGGVATTAHHTARRLAESDPAAALALTEVLLSINPTHAAGNQLSQSLGATLRAAGDGRPPSVELPTPSLRELGTAQLTALAVRFLEMQDPYSGYHFADLSLQVAPTARARVVRDEAARRIASAGLTVEEIAAQSRFARKQHAEASARAGAWEEAYYTWLELAAEDRFDRDIATRLPEATAEVSKITYWLPQANIAALLPGAEELLFANERHPDGTPREVLRLGKLVRTGDGVFAHDIELVHLTPNGERTLHVVADHGRIQGRQLLLVGLQPGQRQPPTLPVVLHGGDAPRSVTLTPSVDDLYLLREPTLTRHGIGELRRVAELRAGLGSDALAERMALASTASKPMFALALLVTAAWLGTWGRRAAVLSTWLELALLPAVAVAALLVAELWWFAHATLANGATAALGLWAGAAIAAGAELIAAAVALALLARSHSRGAA